MYCSIECRDIYSLFDSRLEMNLLIPCTSVLCIAMIVFAARMLRKLIDESNQKIEVRIYQDRIREMEQHIGDIENLYAGTRGMGLRHIEMCAQKYYGKAETTVRENEFELAVMLQKRVE